MPTFYEKLGKTIAKLQAPSKFGKPMRYYLDKRLASFVEFNGFPPDVSTNFAGRKPGRAKESDLTIACGKAQWLTLGPAETEGGPGTPVVPEEGHTVRVGGKDYLITGIGENEVTYTLTCTDKNR